MFSLPYYRNNEGRWFPEQGRQEQAPGAEGADCGTEPVSSCPASDPPGGSQGIQACREMLLQTKPLERSCKDHRFLRRTSPFICEAFKFTFIMRIQSTGGTKTIPTKDTIPSEKAAVE